MNSLVSKGFTFIACLAVVLTSVQTSEVEGFQGSIRRTTTSETTRGSLPLVARSIERGQLQTTTSSAACRIPSSSSLNLISFGKKEEKIVVDEEEEDETEESSGWTDFGTDPLSYAYAGAWLSLLSFAFVFAPGELQSTSDSAMIQSILDNPSAPAGMNPFYYGIFNVFTLIPIILGCVIAPRDASDKGGIPSGPPIFLSTFIAYFVMGPYLALRKTPKTEFREGDKLGWITRNVWENKLFNWGTVAFGFFTFAAGAAPGLNDPIGNFQGMIELIQSSRFASVSIADLSLITIILTKEVADDYKIRCRGVNSNNINKAPWIGASTALLPLIGAAIYCALRPSLLKPADE